jgi:minor extracellular serine protease Vpr
MKKAIKLLTLGILLSASASAQKEVAKLPALSPLTKLYLQRAVSTGAIQPNYVYKQDGAGNTYISSLVKINISHVTGVTASLETIGARVGTKAGNIWTVQVPLQNVREFTQVKGIDYIQLDEPAFPELNEARKATRVDSVHAGINLFCPFRGDGIVMGIIDAGFDYSHPVFFDTTGTHYRVKKVWEQKNAGTPPAAFSYGNEITDSLTMWAEGTDNGQTHGTHVGGIAAGSGFGGSVDNRVLRGVAFESDLVFVGITPDKDQWMNTGAADMIDGMNYIFSYAASVGKPAVANLSWGNPVGPRDGTSLFSIACDNLTGQGKIFVCSGGNNGEKKIHLNKTFSATDTVINTFLNIAENPLGKVTWVDVWGQPSQTFCAKVKLYTKQSGFIDSTDFICLDNAIHNQYIIGSNSDTCFIDFITATQEFNGKPRLLMEFRSKITDSICISVSGQAGSIDVWNNYVHNTTGYTGSFESNGMTWAVTGDNITTISDLASTKTALTVGAYASKTSFTNLNGNSLSYSGYVNTGNLVPFSSRGPAIDGRVKPDITGPGLTLGSAASSYDIGFQSGGDSYDYVVRTYNFSRTGRTYPFAMLSGTSMSSPATAGIVALMLQANPKLAPQQVKDIIFTTAIKDNFTGAIPSGGNNNWGNGKVNAYAAVAKAWQTNSVKEINSSTIRYELYPNPGNGIFSISYQSKNDELATVEVFNMDGKKAFTTAWKIHTGNNNTTLNLSHLPKGFYFTQLTSNAGFSIIKTVIE